jgi:hypothetical protein
LPDRSRRPSTGHHRRDPGSDEKQEGLDALASRIRARAVETATSGLAGIVVSPEHNSLRLYWRGVLPSGVAREVAGAHATGITVEVHRAKYTFAQLDAEAAQFAGRYLGADGTAEPVVSVVPNGSVLSNTGLPA